MTKASGIVDALDDKEVSGSLITLLQSGEEFVRNNTKKRWKKTNTGRIEMPEYPERAVHVSYKHLRPHETAAKLLCRNLL